MLLVWIVVIDGSANYEKTYNILFAKYLISMYNIIMEAINNQYDIRVKSLYNHCIHLVRNINGMHINASRKKYDIDEITNDGMR